jgi:hypothetical protein
MFLADHTESVKSHEFESLLGDEISFTMEQHEWMSWFVFFDDSHSKIKLFPADVLLLIIIDGIEEISVLLIDVAAKCRVAAVHVCA